MDIINLLKSARSDTELSELLKVLLSNNEHTLLNNRAQILAGLIQGSSYKQIESHTGTSSATISKINLRLHEASLTNLKKRLLKKSLS